MGMTEEQKAHLRQHTIATRALYPKLKEFPDFSLWNGEIDFVKVKSFSDVAFLKASEGAKIRDPRYKKYYKAAKAAGLRVSAYLFYRPGDDIDAQVELYCEQVGELAADDLAPTLDAERATPDLTAAQDNDRFSRIIRKLEDRFGVKPTIYSSRRYCEQEGITAGGDCFWWVVDYVNKSGWKVPKHVPREKVFGVQIGFKPGVPGCEGDVDCSLAFLPWEAIALHPRKVPPVVYPLDTSALDAPFVMPADLPGLAPGEV